ncbi:MAG: hypothetical protein ACK5XF_02440 [Neisseriaceae bacterium]
MRYINILFIFSRHIFRKLLRIKFIKYIIKIFLQVYRIKQDNISKLFKYHDIIEEELYILSDGKFEVDGGGMFTGENVTERDIDIVRADDIWYYGSIDINGKFKWHENENPIPIELNMFIIKIEKRLI